MKRFRQILINAIGQAPLGFGIFLLWPLVHKFGKRRVMAIGFIIGAPGSLGVPMLGYLLGALLQKFFDVEKLLPQMQADIVERHKAEAEARGEVYVSPEEKAALEQAENDRIAEENRINDLKAKCEKKGLRFEEEEAKYQAKLAEQKAKAEAKAAKRSRK